MQSFFERRPSTLDTTQPGIRHIQHLIRHRTPVSVIVAGGLEIEGLIQWQDLSYLAISQDGRPLTLVNRGAITILRALG
ncbi:MAG: hypothetical protein VKM97_04305 [Cyanobacteriota bacterium]|nr:hypothetical protein [Cyanobacteriota bacterium]